MRRGASSPLGASVRDGGVNFSVFIPLGSGRFSSDRTIAEYARDIWGVQPWRVS